MLNLNACSHHFAQDILGLLINVCFLLPTSVRLIELYQAALPYFFGGTYCALESCLRLSLLIQMTVVIMPKFNFQEYLKTIERYKITHLLYAIQSFEYSRKMLHRTAFIQYGSSYCDAVM